MISQTGNKRSGWQRGLSLFEVLVAASVFSLGVVFIYRAFITSLDYLHHLNARVQANLLLDNSISECERNLKLTNELPVNLLDSVQTILLNNKPSDFFLSKEVIPIDGVSDLLQINLWVRWQEGARQIELKRSAYISNFKSTTPG